VRDTISAKEYEPLCSKLIGQYKTLYESLRDQASPPHITDSIWVDEKYSLCARGGR